MCTRLILAAAVGATAMILSSPACQKNPTSEQASDAATQVAAALPDDHAFDDATPTISSNILPSEYRFEAPFRVKAGDEYIAVEPPGYACPTMADVDGDGVDDLVVGQFRNGNMRFYRNVAESGQPPRFETGEWLMTGDARAIVPGVW